MLKILYLDHAPVFGGAEKALLDLVRSFDRQQYQPLVATASDSAFLPILAAEGIRTTTMPFEQVNMRHPAFLLRLVRSTLALVRLVRHEHPDVLHSNTVRGHVVSSLASLITGVPLVWTMHDRTLPGPLFRFLGRVPRRIIFVSRYLSDLYMSGGPNPHRGQVIPNGARPAPPQGRAEARRKLGLAPDCPVIVNVGRLVDGKGQDVFVQAAALVGQHRPDAVFLVVGGTNEGDPASARYAQRLSELAHSLNLEGKAIFTGHQQDLTSYYDSADLCAYTAVGPEGFGLVVLEAMAHGKAVVASNLGAVPEIVLDGVTGRLVRPNEVVDLAKAILDLLADREALNRLGAAGRQRVAKHFDPQEGFRRIQAVYDEVLLEATLGKRSASP
ncbi:MAG: glycosyltransferase family 4 protein [Dehalococcoidia bacterium]|nr:glycosyltransferase family 4 protein [Dehalococcoidia bacterium]